MNISSSSLVKYWAEHPNGKVRADCYPICETIANILKSTNPHDTLKRRDLAIELYKSGLGYKRIARAMNLTRDMVRDWVKTFYFCVPRRGNYKYIPNPALSTRLRNAATAEEWRTVLREHMSLDFAESKSIHLICEVTEINQCASTLAAIVQARLKQNPFSGETFAFCGKKRRVIKCIAWDGEGFRTYERRLEHANRALAGSKIRNIDRIE